MGVITSCCRNKDVLLVEAAKENNLPELCKHLEEKADPNYIKRNDPGLLCESPLINAIKHNNIQMITTLLRAGADPNQLDVLTTVLLYGDVEILKILLDGRLDMKRLHSSSLYQCHAAFTALSRVDMLRLLLDYGLDPNIVDQTNGKSLLHMAVIRRYSDSVRLLLSKGADMFRLDNEHKTPMNYAQDNDYFVQV